MNKEIYIIVACAGGNIQYLANQKIKEGYIPLGGIAIIQSTPGLYTFYQAMILKEII